MVSLDDAEKNAEFAASLGTALPVISDPEGVVGKEYGVLALGGFYARRWTFYIDIEGRIRAVDKDVSPETAGADMVRKLAELDYRKRVSDSE
jgi:peroxiredoxin Q/BCP